jgi:hypothetical protein
VLWILIGVQMNLQTNLVNVAILTILYLSFHLHGIPCIHLGLQFFQFYSFQFTRLVFLLINLFLSILLFWNQYKWKYFYNFLLGLFITVFRNTSDFYMLVFDLPSWTHLFFKQVLLFVDSLRSSTCKYMTSINRDSFMSFLSGYLLFLLPNCSYSSLQYNVKQKWWQWTSLTCHQEQWSLFYF